MPILVCRDFYVVSNYKLFTSKLTLNYQLKTNEFPISSIDMRIRQNTMILMTCQQKQYNKLKLFTSHWLLMFEGLFILLFRIPLLMIKSFPYSDSCRLGVRELNGFTERQTIFWYDRWISLAGCQDPFVTCNDKHGDSCCLLTFLLV